MADANGRRASRGPPRADPPLRVHSGAAAGRYPGTACPGGLPRRAGTRATMPAGPERPNDGESFEAAIAHHQLELQTELKKASSLPSAMFDASDPMLEARLCEATESIFRCLMDLGAPPDLDETATPERRLEIVPAGELAALLLAAAGGAFADREPPPLDGGEREMFAILADVVGRGRGRAARRAAELLASGSGAAADLGALTRELAAQFADAAGSEGGDDQVEALCRRVAAAVLQSVRQAERPPNGPEAGA